MSEAALIEGYLTLYRADMQAHCLTHWNRVLAQLKQDNPKLAQKVESKLK